MRKISSVIAALLAAAMLCSCSAESAEDTSADDVPEEETEAQTLTIDDPEYYTRFKGQNISINVYNWGEYICTGADEGTLNVNAEFTALTGIKVNYTNYATNEELYAKLKGGGASYDIIIPSDYMINKMIKEKWCRSLTMTISPTSSTSCPISAILNMTPIMNIPCHIHGEQSASSTMRL